MTQTYGHFLYVLGYTWGFARGWPDYIAEGWRMNRGAWRIYAVLHRIWISPGGFIVGMREPR